MRGPMTGSACPLFELHSLIDGGHARLRAFAPSTIPCSHDDLVAPLRNARPPVSGITKNYSPKPPAKPSRNSLQRRRRDQSTRRGCCPCQADARRTQQIQIGRPSMSSTAMSKRIALLSAVAFSALALTSTFVVPARAEEKTVMVGGAAMYPSKNIIQNAVNSKDHTTLVAA